MTFTEVAFELADARHPLCRLTRVPSRAHAVYRILDHGETTRRHRAHLLVHGPPELASELANGLCGLRADVVVEPLDRAHNQTSFTVELSLDDVTAPPGLAGIVPALNRSGLPVLVDPIVAREGRIHVRLVIPRQVDAQDVLRALQEVQRAAGFVDFRIARIAPLAPGAHVEMARRALIPDQEVLLALAASMGYYETPKAVTLEQIARSVGLSISPVHKRLKAAEEALVAQHVVHAAPLPRRRPRRLGPLEPTSPWEIQLRVAADFGPAQVLNEFPEARASLHVLSTDAGMAQSSLLVVVGPEDAQTKFVSGLESRPEVAGVTLIERSTDHLAARLTTHERGTYSFSWWTETWGYDASVRSLLLQGEHAHVRGILTRPFTVERLDERLRDCARVAGWSQWEVESLRSLADVAPPPTWPEPLTQRQLEVLRVAHALGYYRTPRGCTLEHVATTLGISANAVHKNLVLAESKLISAYLASGL